MPIKAIICDLDGLLTDTETLHFKSYVTVFERLGIPITESDYADHWIRQGRGIAEFITGHGLTHDAEVIREQKIATYLELLKTDLQPMPGAISLLDRFAATKRLALASSAFRISVESVLDELGLLDRFEAIVCGDEVTHKKPHPEIFLSTADRLGAAPAACVVLEDAEKGVRAAHAAGMACIAVPNQFTRANDFSSADRVVDSLDEVTVELLVQLGTERQ